jgi:hypothetical protein
VSACIPFTVGNTNLNYVVTRRAAGDYLVGLFNDKETNETFSITCHIGTITSQVDVALNDNLAELKEVAGGAAYATPIQRATTNIPSYYGLSDASNIEGRDFRLFRLYVDETNSRAMPSVSYPVRPAGRVLSIASTSYIREYTQSLPSFFQWFDGVCIGTNDLLGTSDAWLTAQQLFLSRRGVRLVVDGDGLNDSTLIDVIGKLALVRNTPRDLIVASPSASVQAAATSASVRLVEPVDVNTAAGLNDAFDTNATLNIVARYYASGDENNVYHDLCHFRDGESVTQISGAATPAGLYDGFSAPASASNDFFYLGYHLHDLGGRLQQDSAELSKLSGVMIDSTYLLTRTSTQLTVDKAQLDALGLELVVDLRRDQMHFDRIAWYPHIPNYSSGTNLYMEIADKMQSMGSSNLLLRVRDVGRHGEQPHLYRATRFNVADVCGRS